jgi:hypothetical protein
MAGFARRSGHSARGALSIGMNMGSVIDIDGSYGEGGGQVLRTALALSMLTGSSTRIRNIRAGRRNPGLAPRHLTGVLAAARICDTEIEGAEIGFAEIRFAPHRAVPRERSFDFDVTRVTRGGSAGSVTLVLQTELYPLAFPSQATMLTISGGTHVAWSPSVAIGACGPEDDHTQLSNLAPVSLTERGRLERITGRKTLPVPSRSTASVHGRPNGDERRLTSSLIRTSPRHARIETGKSGPRRLLRKRP